nr:PREDICTED: uncharacterized protein LOC105664222 [Megachile rotundata]
MRLNRRKYGENGKVEWVPSESVLITFEGGILPDFIKVYGLYNMKIEVYIEPIKVCYKCFRFGHLSFVKVYLDVDSVGHRRSTQKRVLAPEKEISKIKAFKNVPHLEAKKMAMGCLGLVQGNAVSHFPAVTSENFPELKKPSPENIITIKSFGGQEIPSSPASSSWKNTPSFSKNLTHSSRNSPVNISDKSDIKVSHLSSNKICKDNYAAKSVLKVAVKVLRETSDTVSNRSSSSIASSSNKKADINTLPAAHLLKRRYAAAGEIHAGPIARQR